ncbi:LLM class flavin-dependent oxidoreductase [Pseudorhodoplanes sinuspersici]|uniref:LLM class flavin-dependent oxidoreductase n=1 Tax=Pseudorhodoplanes sinuspersici TaxID=1235591 RepID=A0A1W6ZZ38_9HYPH|nr:LLM class flavin-dependent oxidoreductase [Pseudorhodoplanes sinuspersici]ARQ02649.1 LLM class flavin-dependent oxidoreductase [Pseudorhodoplanes sinuspersici]RKE74524.1 alkanesulfonate monooxygenase SsuD/methylene tetrahydromethanopterin reductase-like flavin-dependent oxidoreductase (luciferase family) [Pseudorhodoplanes sinuspersici]
MKFYMMHLMPYADLDLDYDQKHNSAWVTLPNSYYDPKKGAKLYNRYLDELEYADQLGFDGICVNEHHQNAYGLMPQPGVMAGALARRTKKVKIAILGRALPLLNNPVTVAEEFAMVDNITEGRFIAGFVRGIGAEYHAWSSNPADSHDRFHEAHDLILRAWTETGPFAFEGKHYQFEYVNLWPRPYQSPRPPIWIPSQGSSETIEWASHPDRRYTYLQTFTPVAMLAKYMQMYKAMAAGHGYEATEDQLGWSVPLYVAETDEIARREAQPHIENFLNKFLRMPKEMLLPPGYLSLNSMLGVMKAKSSIGTKQTIDDVMAKGMFICGSPETVRQKLEQYQSEIGFGHLLTLLQFGTLPAELTRKNMEIYANEVMPYLRDKTANAIPAAAE